MKVPRRLDRNNARENRVRQHARLKWGHGPAIETANSLLVAYVGHHDRAYAWAERRRIEAHPTTGAVQIVEVRERVEQVAAVGPAVAAATPPEAAVQLSFAGLDDAALLSVGVQYLSTPPSGEPGYPARDG
jgi:hypothetical protein